MNWTGPFLVSRTRTVGWTKHYNFLNFRTSELPKLHWLLCFLMTWNEWKRRLPKSVQIMNAKWGKEANPKIVWLRTHLKPLTTVIIRASSRIRSIRTDLNLYSLLSLLFDELFEIWWENIIFNLKVRKNQKHVVDSPKKWTNEFHYFAVKSKKAYKTNWFICFLGESTVHKLLLVLSDL